MRLIGLIVKCYVALAWAIVAIFLAPVAIVGHLLTLK